MSHDGRIDSVGDEPRARTRQLDEVAGKTWFRDLDEAVIEADRCVECGSCVAACPSDSIGIDDRGRPSLVRMCTGCSRCWDFCPRAGLRHERLWTLAGDHDPERVAARARDGAGGQDGGAVTALLAGLLRRGEIDGALVATDGDRPMEGAATLATTPEDVREAAGSFYNQTMALGHLGQQLGDAVASGELPDDPELALVGTPCEVEGVTALQRYPWDGDEAVASVALTIGLMCTRNFDYQRLRLEVEAERGVALDDVGKMDVREGELVALDEDGDELLREDVEAFEDAALRGCAECADFTGRTADVTAGSIGSPEGWTTLVVRTDAGLDALDAAGDALETRDDVDEDRLSSVDDWNLRTAVEALPRDFDEGAPLDVTLEEHHESYVGTDRDPKPLNRARVHRYEERC